MLRKKYEVKYVLRKRTGCLGHNDQGVNISMKYTFKMRLKFTKKPCICDTFNNKDNKLTNKKVYRHVRASQGVAFQTGLSQKAWHLQVDFDTTEVSGI